MKWFLLVLLIFVAGCDFNTDADSVFLTAEISPIGDRSGLILMDRSEERMPLSIVITNPMSEDASDVRLVASNVNNRIIDMSVVGDESIPRLQGTRALMGSPGVALRELDIGIALGLREYSTRIDYHLCAQTSTVYDGVLCISPVGYRDHTGEGCQPRDVQVSERQGAPVSVVAMRQTDSLNSVSIMFDLVNYGNGIVFEYDGERCSYIGQEHAGRITLTSLRIGEQEVPCMSDDPHPTRRMGFDRQYQRYTGVTFQCVIDKNLIVSGSQVPVARPVSATFTYGYHVNAGQQIVSVRATPGQAYPDEIKTISSAGTPYEVLVQV